MAGRRGRKIDPNSVTQRILAELADEQWKDTHELARVLGAPARRVGDIFSVLSEGASEVCGPMRRMREPATAGY